MDSDDEEDTCESCREMYSYQTNNTGRYICEDCPKCFRTISDIRELIIEPEESVAESLKCQICLEFFSNPVICCGENDPECIFCYSCLEEHIYHLDNTGSFSNGNCPKCFRTISELTIYEDERDQWIEMLPKNKFIQNLINNQLKACRGQIDQSEVK